MRTASSALGGRCHGGSARDGSGRVSRFLPAMAGQPVRASPARGGGARPTRRVARPLPDPLTSLANQPTLAHKMGITVFLSRADGDREGAGTAGMPLSYGWRHRQRSPAFPSLQRARRDAGGRRGDRFAGCRIEAPGRHRGHWCQNLRLMVGWERPPSERRGKACPRFCSVFSWCSWCCRCGSSFIH
ncbi:MAG: hypothetical protein OZSIB_3558 [Candidatus Ozemobacter sibiricus]|uniref:Uncharacterized protein n=1 Tax=Candidatus Ozemobacter sibiricus TaxID=2268124 RepID=A0A367ZPI9_9BACT|nr:MAG: hypothetical protein OZSIB_3558 [Candidatus Ozemobacter sibiricus]